MYTVHDLYIKGVLVKYQPIALPGKRELRDLYLTKEAHQWCLGKKKCLEIYGYDSPSGNEFKIVAESFVNFCTNPILSENNDLKKLSRSHHVWEIKTVPDKNSIRTFGWFYKRNCFVGVCCEYKYMLKKFGYETNINRVDEFRNEAKLTKPDRITSDRIQEVV